MWLNRAHGKFQLPSSTFTPVPRALNFAAYVVMETATTVLESYTRITLN